MLLQAFARKGSAAALFFAAVAGLASTAHADTVLDTGFGSYVETSFNSPGKSTSTKQTNITALPSAGTDSIGGGGDTASTTYSFTATAFDTSFSDTRTGAQGSNDHSLSYLYFTVNDATTSYDVSGSYTFSTPYAAFQTQLFDLTANAAVFASDNETDNSFSTLGGTFTVGGSQGEATAKHGTFSGILLAGHHYQYFQFAEIDAFPNADTGATASGSLALTFTDSATPLPTTASAGLGLMACLGLLQLARRRKAQLV